MQHRVEEQARADQLALRGRLVAELVHAVELAERDDARQQPRQLGVLRHVALAEEDAAVGIEPRGDQDRRRVVRALAQLGRLVRDGHRVQVDDAVDRRVGAVLAGDVLDDRADVVAEVLAPGGLDAGEDDHRPRSLGARPRRRGVRAGRATLPRSPCPPVSGRTATARPRLASALPLRPLTQVPPGSWMPRRVKSLTRGLEPERNPARLRARAPGLEREHERDRGDDAAEDLERRSAGPSGVTRMPASTRAPTATRRRRRRTPTSPAARCSLRDRDRRARAARRGRRRRSRRRRSARR